MTAIIYFLLWAALIFVMMRFGCGAHVIGHRHSHQHGHRGADSDKNGEIIAPLKAIDLVCGMTVETATAKSSVHDRRIYYFCSQNCREQFEAAPQTYTKSSAVSPTSTEAHHGAR